jgi:hypothetical protein
MENLTLCHNEFDVAPEEMRSPLSKGCDSPRNIVQSVILMQGPETFRRN